MCLGPLSPAWETQGLVLVHVSAYGRESHSLSRPDADMHGSAG